MSHEKQDKIVIDFSVQKTEHGWGTVLRDFSLKVAPLWFNWIAWVITLGAIQFMHQKTDAFGFLIIRLYRSFFYFGISSAFSSASR